LPKHPLVIKGQILRFANATHSDNLAHQYVA